MWTNQEIEFNELGFYVTWFPCIEMEFIELGFCVSSRLTFTWVLSWKSSLLDSISINGPHFSTCCCGSQLGPIFPSLSAISELLHTHFFTTLSTLSWEVSIHNTFSTLHYIHLTQYISGIQYYLLVFFFF